MEHGVTRGETLEAILATTGTRRRLAERLFTARLGTSPGRFYRELRLRHALDLMRGAAERRSDDALIDRIA